MSTTIPTYKVTECRAVDYRPTIPTYKVTECRAVDYRPMLGQAVSITVYECRLEGQPFAPAIYRWRVTSYRPDCFLEGAENYPSSASAMAAGMVAAWDALPPAEQRYRTTEENERDLRAAVKQAITEQVRI